MKSTLRACLLVGTFALASGVPQIAMSQTLQSDDAQYDQQFKAQSQQILRMRDDLQRLVESATSSMKEVAGLDPSKVGIDQLKKPMLEFRSKLQSLLDMFDDQADFATAIDAARASASRALAWWQRQPQSEQQQRIIKDLQGSLAQYENMDKKRLDLRNETSKQLSLVMSRQIQIERIAQTTRIIDASRQLAPILEGMSQLTKSLGVIAQPSAGGS